MWSAFDKWFARVVTFATFATLGRLLSPSDFGIVAGALVVITLLRTVSDNCLIPSLIIDSAGTMGRTKTTGFWLGVLSGIMMAALGAIVAPLVARMFGMSELDQVLMVLSTVLIIRGLAVVPEAVLRAEMRFKAIAVRSAVSTTVGAIVGIALALSGYGVWALVGQTLSQALTSTVIMWAAVPFLPKGRPEIESLRRLSLLGSKLVAVELATVVVTQGDNIVVGVLLGHRALGYYSVGYRLFSVLSESFTGVLSALSLSVFVRFRDDKFAAAEALRRATKLSLVGSLPLFLVMSSLAPVLIPWVFGQRWAPSAVVLQWLCVAGIVASVTYFDQSVLYSMGQVHRELSIVVIAAIATIVLTSLGALFGLAWVAAAVAIRYLVTWPLRMRALRAAIGVRWTDLARTWMEPALAGVAFMIASTVVTTTLREWSAPGRRLMAAIAGLLVYASWLVVRDLAFVRQTVAMIRN